MFAFFGSEGEGVALQLFALRGALSYRGSDERMRGGDGRMRVIFLPKETTFWAENLEKITNFGAEYAKILEKSMLFHFLIF